MGATCRLVSNQVLGNNCHVDSLVREQIDESFEPNVTDIIEGEGDQDSQKNTDWMGLTEATIKRHSNFIEIKMNTRLLANKIIEMYSTPFDFRTLMQHVQDLVA